MDYSGSAPLLVQEGRWAGWRLWDTEPFEQAAGPFYFRHADDAVLCAFEVEARHLNGAGGVHGGCLMTFADYCLFALSEPHWSGRPAVTVSASCDFVGVAGRGDLVEARGETVRATRSMIFVRGLATVQARPILMFSGVLKVSGSGAGPDPLPRAQAWHGRLAGPV